MNALVTGAGGFLGLYIVEQLAARGDRVRGLGRGAYPALDKLGVEALRVDLRDREGVVAACKGMDCVFHVGAIAGMGGRWRDYYEINALGTQHVLEGCRRHGVGRLVYTSSPSVTFNGGDQCGIDEATPYPARWLCHYPRSKALGEQQALAANGAELLTCSLRPHLIWGPRDNHLIPRLIARAKSGRLRRVGDGRNLIDMIYVENAATAHLQAADALAPNAAVCGRAYFLSQGEPVNCWGWIDELLAAVGLPPVKKAISFRAAWTLGAAVELAYAALALRGEPPMTRFLAAQLAKSHYFNITRAREDFGYRAEISTQEGMRRWIASLS